MALSKLGLMAAIAAMVPSLPLEPRDVIRRNKRRKERKAQRKARRITRQHEERS